MPSRALLHKCLCLIALSCLGPAACAAGAKIGLFPVRVAAGLPNADLATGALMISANDGLLHGLQDANLGEVVRLAWPDALQRDDRPTFETLVQRGLEAGCSGVVALQINALSFTVKEMKLPLIGTINKADAQVTFGGGLIDVATARAVAPINAKGTASDRRYDGPPNVTADAGRLAKSPLGKALAEAEKQTVGAVKAGVGKLSAAPPPPPARANPPDGISFARDPYAFEFMPGYDLRGVVAVVNRGAAAQSFIIKAPPAGLDFVVGLKGEGSIDGPCTLAPGQCKYVRLIATAPQAKDDCEMKLALYVGDAGQTPATDGDPHDQATVSLHWLRCDANLRFTVLGQDPLTLAYRCQVINLSDKEAVPLGFQVADPVQKRFVRLEPGAMHATLAPGASFTFSVVPSLAPGMAPMDVTVEDQTHHYSEIHKFHFEIPAGKQVFYGLSHTSESTGSSSSFCTNTTGSCRVPDSGLSDILGSVWSRIVVGVGGDFPEIPVGRSHPDVRGATIRPAVDRRLGALNTDASTHPMAGWGKGCVGLAWYAPAAEGRTAIYFAQLVWAGANRTMEPTAPIVLNNSDHSARWPYVRVLPNGTRALVVWEDSAPGQKSNVAICVSGEGLRNFGDVRFVTRHGQGVDDPVVHVDAQGKTVVAWGDLRAGASQIYLRLGSDCGATFTPEVALPKAADEADAWPQVDFLPDGRLALVYAATAAGQTRILSRLLDARGGCIGDPVALSHPGVPCGEPQIACAADGRLYSVWREGDGEDSQAWFATAPGPGQAWSAPLQINSGKGYAEYPLVNAAQKMVWVTWHSDASGVADLKYYRESADNGRTWSDPVTLPSMEEVAQSAWVEINFALQWPRSHYQPHTTVICVNGTEVGRLEKTVPEGTYLFPVRPALVHCGATGPESNVISVRAEGINRANYVRAARFRLIISRRFTQVPLIAGSQAEADQLAAHAGVGLNHDQPDLALTANHMGPLPETPKQGQNIAVTLQVQNLGEGLATEAAVVLYCADPRDPLADLGKARLADQRLGEMKPGEVRQVNLAFRFDSKRTSRVWVAARSKEEDAWPGDNVWALSLTAGEEPRATPLLGTDIPDAFSAPQLLNVVRLPALPSLTELVSLPNFGSLVGGVSAPSLPDLGGVLQSQLRGLSIQRPDLGDLGGLLGR